MGDFVRHEYKIGTPSQLCIATDVYLKSERRIYRLALAAFSLRKDKLFLELLFCTCNGLKLKYICDIGNGNFVALQQFEGVY